MGMKDGRDPDPRSDREKRLAKALKSNLKRRKEQQRAREKSGSRAAPEGAEKAGS